jgi:hypothetical protein
VLALRNTSLPQINCCGARMKPCQNGRACSSLLPQFNKCEPPWPGSSYARPRPANVVAAGEKLIQREPQSLSHRTLLALALLRQERAEDAVTVYSQLQVKQDAVSGSALTCMPPFWLPLQIWKMPKPRQCSSSEINFFPKNKRLLKASCDQRQTEAGKLNRSAFEQHSGVNGFHQVITEESSR